MVSALVQKFRNDTAPRLLDKFSNGGVNVVLREPLYGVATVTPEDDGSGFAIYSDGSIIAPVGIMSGYLISGSGIAVIGPVSAGDTDILMVGDLTDILDNSVVLWDGVYHEVVEIQYAESLGVTIMSFAGISLVSGQTYTISFGQDPLSLPKYTNTAAPVNAVARGVSSALVGADPNLVSTDVQVIVAAIDYTPEVGKDVDVNGIQRQIVRVDAIPAAGDPAIYRFFVR